MIGGFLIASKSSIPMLLVLAIVVSGFLIWAALFLVFLAVQDSKDARSKARPVSRPRPKTSTPKPQSKYPGLNPHFNPYPIQSKLTPWDMNWDDYTWALCHRLMQQVGEDMEMAHYLLLQSRAQNKGRPLNWHFEKVVDRLEPPMLYASQATQSQRVPMSHRESELHTDLMTLLRGDQATAKRLLSQVQERNPHQSREWVYEKVIFDLERDRR